MCTINDHEISDVFLTDGVMQRRQIKCVINTYLIMPVPMADVANVLSGMLCLLT